MSKTSVVTKAIITFVGMLAGGLYTTFVLMILWNWFVTPTFHTSEMSFWAMFGLLLLVRLVKDDYYERAQDESRWKKLLVMVQAAIPVEKWEVVKEELLADEPTSAEMSQTMILAEFGVATLQRFS